MLDLERTVESLRQSLAIVAARRAQHGRHGRPGRDGIGRAGKDGIDGKDVDPELVAQSIAASVQVEVAKIPIPKDGRDGIDGKDAPPLEVIVEQALALIPTPKDGLDGVGSKGDIGTKGERGQKGERGEVGPMPAHRWDGTKLQFEQTPGGQWGPEVDLVGPRGIAGRNGGGGGSTAAAVLPALADITGFGAGVEAWLGVPSSANLRTALTDPVGTGGAVFANSPTLVTPNIGAAVAASLVVTSGGALQLGNAATTGLVAGVLAATTNATVAITDSTGQVYRIPCII